MDIHAATEEAYKKGYEDGKREYIAQEAVLAEIENEYKGVEKIKTPFAKIIVDGPAERPYYSIMWLDATNKGYNVGYSSYCLDYVFKWLEVVFENVAADELPVNRVDVGDCEGCAYSHRKRPQKCSCCRRNPDMKDCYEWEGR